MTVGIRTKECGHDITEFAIASVFVPAITPPANEPFGVLLIWSGRKSSFKASDLLYLTRRLVSLEIWLQVNQKAQ
jgi:hypothetical protein